MDCLAVPVPVAAATSAVGIGSSAAEQAARAVEPTGCGHECGLRARHEACSDTKPVRGTRPPARQPEVDVDSDSDVDVDVANAAGQAAAPACCSSYSSCSYSCPLLMLIF